MTQENTKFKVGDIRNGFEVLPMHRRKKVLLLSDDITSNSGVGNMSKEILLGSCHHYNWVQIAGAVKHPKQGQILDISKSVEEETGVPSPYVKLFPVSGYGNPDVMREVLKMEKPDVIMHFTDPRFWGWLYQMENEIRRTTPITYYAIWDDLPYPHYNELFYRSCDLIMGISKQSHNIHKNVLGEEHHWEYDPANTPDVGDDVSAYSSKIYDVYDHLKTMTSYVPHGINKKHFFPMPKDESTTVIMDNLKDRLFPDKEIDFIVYYNNRNIRRKMMGDVMLAFRHFVDQLPKKKKDKCALVMHTNGIDENGTNLYHIIDDLMDGYNIAIDEKKVPPAELGHLYNLADVTINIASNEGFGLSSAESLMCGTMILNNVTGGLQDQVRFEDEKGNWINFTTEFPTNHGGRYKKHGEWAKTVFPTSRAMVGSVPTPYIMDDRCSWEDVGEKLMEIYKIPKAKRDELGLKGHEWVSSDESMMSADNMAKNVMLSFDELQKLWKPRKRFYLINSDEKIRKEKKALGILKTEL